MCWPWAVIGVSSPLWAARSKAKDGMTPLPWIISKLLAASLLGRKPKTKRPSNVHQNMRNREHGASETLPLLSLSSSCGFAVLPDRLASVSPQSSCRGPTSASKCKLSLLRLCAFAHCKAG